MSKAAARDECSLCARANPRTLPCCLLSAPKPYNTMQDVHREAMQEAANSQCATHTLEHPSHLTTSATTIFLILRTCVCTSSHVWHKHFPPNQCRTCTVRQCVRPPTLRCVTVGPAVVVVGLTGWAADAAWTASECWLCCVSGCGFVGVSTQCVFVLLCVACPVRWLAV